MDTNKKAEELLGKLNKELSKMGMLEMRLIEPKALQGQKKNARYFMPEKFKTLVNNIKKEGNLESVPLVVDRNGKIEIISGHHRVDASKEAGLDKILVFVMPSEISQDDLVSKQLSHNALVGLDDKTVLAELFQSIESIEAKIASGLTDEAGKIDYESLNFRVGSFKEFTVMFLPEDLGLFDEAMESCVQDSLVKSSTDVRLSSMEYWDKFSEIIRKVKKVENIKSNGVALMRIIDLAMQKIVESDGIHEEV